ncbi:MAG: regulatory protein RecX [Clostridia bacterium]|nr:regulatory protein RecX [Clostridia bacterium]
MKVTDVSPQKNNSLRVSVFVDGEYSFSLDAAEAVLKGIKTGKELSAKDIKNLLMDCEFSKARDYALGVLSHKAITSHLLMQKLLEKGYDQIIAVEVINELTDLGYIDDFSYATMFLEYCMEKVWGKKKIRFEMKNKGLSDEIIEDVIETIDDDMFFEPMKEIIISKYGCDDLTDIKTKNKITRYFASRGFDFSQINFVIKEISDE